MRAAGRDKVHQKVRCLCGDWEFRRADASVGLSATERHCPRCDSQILLLWRCSEFVGAAELCGHDLMSYLQALSEIEGIGAEEQEKLTRVVRARAKAGLFAA